MEVIRGGVGVIREGVGVFREFVGVIRGAVREIKYLMFVFTFLFWLVGAAVLAISLWLCFCLFQVDGTPSSLLIGVYILIVAGALMMVVGFLGCCGAVRESPCMLGLCFVLLFIICAVTALFLGLSNKDTIAKDVETLYMLLFDKYQNESVRQQKWIFLVIHYIFQCCGKTGSGFVSSQEICPNHVTTSCSTAIHDLIKTRLHIFSGFGIGIIVIMIFGMIFIMLLCCTIKQTRKV